MPLMHATCYALLSLGAGQACPLQNPIRFTPHREQIFVSTHSARQGALIGRRVAQGEVTNAMGGGLRRGGPTNAMGRLRKETGWDESVEERETK